MAKKENIVFYGTGRRKNAIARVRLVEGNGKITINGKDIDEFFGLETLKVIVRQPLTVTDTLDKFDVICTVKVYLFENCGAFLAFLRPYFFLSFIRGSLVKNPATFNVGLYSPLACNKALDIP